MFHKGRIGWAALRPLWGVHPKGSPWLEVPAKPGRQGPDNDPDSGAVANWPGGFSPLKIHKRPGAVRVHGFTGWARLTRCKSYSLSGLRPMKSCAESCPERSPSKMFTF